MVGHAARMLTLQFQQSDSAPSIPATINGYVRAAHQLRAIFMILTRFCPWKVDIDLQSLITCHLFKIRSATSWPCCFLAWADISTWDHLIPMELGTIHLYLGDAEVPQDQILAFRWCTSTTMKSPWAVQPWRSCCRTLYTTSGSSLTTPSTCWGAWIMKVLCKTLVAGSYRSQVS